LFFSFFLSLVRSGLISAAMPAVGGMVHYCTLVYLFPLWGEMWNGAFQMNRYSSFFPSFYFPAFFVVGTDNADDAAPTDEVALFLFSLGRAGPSALAGRRSLFFFSSFPPSPLLRFVKSDVARDEVGRKFFLLPFSSLIVESPRDTAARVGSRCLSPFFFASDDHRLRARIDQHVVMILPSFLFPSFSYERLRRSR